MNKGQIQQKFDEILTGLGYVFWEDGLGHALYDKESLIELMESCFNLGLEVAADNAKADVNIISTETGDYSEVYVLKNSILKFKL